MLDFLEPGNSSSETGDNTQYYANLSASGGTGVNKYAGNPDWEYQELEFKTPLITPSIKGHAQFATEHGIGWARIWYNKKTGVVEIQEIQSDLFQKGRDKDDLVSKKGKYYRVLNINLGEDVTFEPKTYSEAFEQNEDGKWYLKYNKYGGLS